MESSNEACIEGGEVQGLPFLLVELWRLRVALCCEDEPREKNAHFFSWDSQLKVKPKRQSYVLGQVLPICIHNLVWIQAFFSPVGIWDTDNNDKMKMYKWIES